MAEQVDGAWPIVDGEAVSPQLNPVHLGAIYGIVLKSGVQETAADGENQN